MKPLFFTVGEVALICSVSLETVRIWLRDGVLKGQKMGRRWVISIEELAKYLNVTEEKLIKYYESLQG